MLEFWKLRKITLLFADVEVVGRKDLLELFSGDESLTRLHTAYLEHHGVLISSSDRTEYSLSFEGRDLLSGWQSDEMGRGLAMSVKITGGWNFKFLVDLVDVALRNNSMMFPSDAGCVQHEGTVNHIHVQDS